MERVPLLDSPFPMRDRGRACHEPRGRAEEGIGAYTPPLFAEDDKYKSQEFIDAVAYALAELKSNGKA